MGKKKYLKINGPVIWATDKITRDDLAMLKNNSYDAIIDLEAWKKTEKEMDKATGPGGEC